MLKRVLVDKDKFMKSLVENQWKHCPLKRAYIHIDKKYETNISRVYISIIGYENYEVLHQFDPKGLTYIPPRAIITFKGDGDYSEEEYEYDLQFEKAYSMFTICKNKLFIERYFVTVDGHEWNVDEYKMDNDGLIVATTEFENLSEITTPEWMTKDVTFYPQFNPLSLSIHPYNCFNLKDKKNKPCEINTTLDKIKCNTCPRYMKCHSPRYDEAQ